MGIRNWWQHRREPLRVIIFEADTPTGKAFDVVLLWSIVASVLVVMLESVPTLRAHYSTVLRTFEWIFTLLFTVEYLLRLAIVPRPSAYARSFFGVVDLLSILPSYISLLIPGAQSLMVVRGLRLLRVFRVLKLARFRSEGRLLALALYDSRHKITVFVTTVITLVTLIGALMYLIEGEESGFDSVPRGMYWAIVTLTTVGYGDISPQSWLGQTFASLVMIMGYGIIAVPTGIVTAALTQAGEPRPVDTRVCPQCVAEGHDIDAKHCKYCGAGLIY